MRKIFSIILIFSTAFNCYTQNNKEQLTIQVIAKARDFNDIKNILDIIRKQKQIYKYIPSIHPIAKKNKPVVSSLFGMRFHKIDKVYKHHAGMDFVAEYATTIHSTATGEVIFAGNKGGYGKCVMVKHNYGFVTLYGHLTEFYVVQGKKVKKGDIIAFLGNTGKSTGAHLHYEIRKNNKAINPINFLE